MEVSAKRSSTNGTLENSVVGRCSEGHSKQTGVVAMWPPVATTTTFLPDYSRSGTRYSTLRALKKSLFLCGEKPIFSFSATVVRHASDWWSKRCPASLIVSFGIDTFSLPGSSQPHMRQVHSSSHSFLVNAITWTSQKSRQTVYASTWEDERKTDGATIQTYMYPPSLVARTTCTYSRTRTWAHVVLPLFAAPSSNSPLFRP